MSFRLVPLPGELLELKRDAAERELGVVSAVERNPPTPAPRLYEWADDILPKLPDGANDNPKLRLAESLGMTTDPYWAGAVRSLKSTPRHRVVARFARERLWKCIWSLNWDCIQESALINAGIKSNSAVASSAPPWPIRFQTFITAAECEQMGAEGIVHVVKPHGCVRALIQSRSEMNAGNILPSKALADRFLITKTELDSRNLTTGAERFVFHSLCIACSTNPFVIAGWRVSEQYFRDRFNDHVRPILQERVPLPNDELSIIDIEFNRDGHLQLAQCYGKGIADAHVRVEPVKGLTTDNLFLWLQTMYALDRLITWAAGADRAMLSALQLSLNQPPDVFPFAVPWTDGFLTAWVRLCWQLDLVQCRDIANQPIRGDQIAIDASDEHIPWQIDGLPERQDLRAAIRILTSLCNSGHADSWDFGQFPGGFYRNSDNILAVPLPAWMLNTPNDLRGFKPLADSIVASRPGIVRAIWMIPVHWDAAQLVADKTKHELRAALARSLAITRFIGDKIVLKDLTDL